MTLPLAGIRIIDMSRVFAGPWATQLLADLGAEVIKVERPGRGDEMRVIGPPFLQGRDGKPTSEGPFYLSVNRNKKSVAVDIARPEGQDVVRRLAMTADVMLENYKVGDLKRYGLDYAAISAIRPGIVYCSITGFGQTGPYAERPGMDSMFQAMSGLMSITGEPDRPPQRVGFSIVDFICGMYAVSAIQSALYHRDLHGGPGQFIDVSLLDAQMAALSSPAQNYLVSGQIPMRTGTESTAFVPVACFRCADGELSISAGRDDEFRRFCDVMACPELARDERFVSLQGRSAHRAELMAILNEMLSRYSMAELVERMTRARLVHAPINNIAQAFDDPQVKHRDLVTHVTHPLADDVPLIRNPIRFSATPLDRYEAPPLLGQHTREVLKDLLGMDDKAVQELITSQIVQASD